MVIKFPKYTNLKFHILNQTHPTFFNPLKPNFEASSSFNPITSFPTFYPTTSSPTTSSPTLSPISSLPTSFPSSNFPSHFPTIITTTQDVPSSNLYPSTRSSSYLLPTTFYPTNSFKSVVETTSFFHSTTTAGKP